MMFQNENKTVESMTELINSGVITYELQIQGFTLIPTFVEYCPEMNRK